MIVLLFKDAWIWVSFLGISMIAIVEWMTRHINPIMATVTMILGAILLVLGIVEKAMIVKAKWQGRPSRKK
jgi:uncharacterized membrane protein HdeD (DUF308 family)